MSFIKLLFQHILINIEDIMSQTILIKTAQSFKLINQFRFRKLNFNLIINSLIQILRHNIPAVVIMIIFQKMI